MVKRIGILVLLLFPLLAASGAAEASVSGVARNGPVIRHTINYGPSWTFKDKSLNRCVTYKVTGSIKYNTQVLEPSGDIEWTNQRLSPQPTFTASVHSYNRGSCKGSAKLYKIDMGQHWSGYSCSFNPAISFSAPWGIGVSFWPSCGNKRQVSYTSDYGSSSSYTQYTNGVPSLTFGDYGGLPGQNPCYGVYVSSQNYVNRSTSNIYQSGGHEICLPS